MVYDIYFHNDFDGRASAAVLLAFLEGRGDTIENYVPVDHSIKLKKNWPKLKFKNPAVILDFYYHPKAAFWFDHHETTFLTREWKTRFRQSKFHQLHASYLSCCHVVLDGLIKEFAFRPPAHLRELAKWLNITDGAKYASARQTILMKEPALQIDAFIDSQKGRKPLAWLIRLLAEKPLAAVAANPRIKNAVSKIEKRRKELLKAYRKNIQMHGATAFLDISKIRGEYLRFAAYYFYPRTKYSIVLKKSRTLFGIGVGKNPWLNFKNIHLGEFLQKRYGGGGHAGAAGARFKTRQEAERAIQEIIKHLA
jgi:oligoribonuclease NrnB/cAMP/cGMP phosphodiesterase (DHH superfamily)